MHYSCVAPELPGRPQPCPRCSRKFQGEEAEAWPHELEVGAPRRKTWRPPKVGVDAAQDSGVPFPLTRPVTDEEACAAGYSDVKDWYCKSASASLAGLHGAGVEYRSLPDPILDPADVEFEPFLDSDTVLVAKGEAIPPGDGDGIGASPPVIGPGPEWDQRALSALRMHEEAMTRALDIERPYLLLDIVRVLPSSSRCSSLPAETIDGRVCTQRHGVVMAGYIMEALPTLRRTHGTIAWSIW